MGNPLDEAQMAFLIAGSVVVEARRAVQQEVEGTREYKAAVSRLKSAERALNKAGARYNRLKNRS